MARFLTSEEGAILLEEARVTRNLAPHRRVERLRALTGPDRAHAVLEQDDLRRRALPRCPHAEALLFTRAALEQATAWPVAAERARRWPGPSDSPLFDLGAGIGLDTLAAAVAGHRVTAVERDPGRALLLAHNAGALDVAGRVEVLAADVLEAGLSGPLAFLDPGRRPEGRRTRDAEAFEPPRSTWGPLLGGFAAAMLKLPPSSPRETRRGPQANPDGTGLPHRRPAGGLAGGSDVPAWGSSGAWPEGLASQPPFEVVSLDGRARERRLFLGDFGHLPPRRALSLPSGHAIAGTGVPWPSARVPQEGDWLLDPDPAVTLAGLVGDLAAEHQLAPVHPRIAYLLGSERPSAAPGRVLRVDALLRPRPREVNAWLRSQGAGRLTIKTRGVADDAAAWRKRLKPGRGDAEAVLVFTRTLDDHWIALGSLPSGE